MGRKYRNLIDHIVADENMRSAYRKTARGRRYAFGALEFKEHAEVRLAMLARDIEAGKYKPGTPNKFFVYEPKPRLITALPFRDRVAQHALCNVVAPIFERTFLPRSYACRAGKGVHAGVIDIQAEMRRMAKAGPVHFLKTDFARYFPSIDRAVLSRLIRKKITCAATLRLIEAMVPPAGIGLPIGSLTSQLFANVYGTALDRFLQQEMKVGTWFRYMDDVVVLGHDPAHLHNLRHQIEKFAHAQLGLAFSKWSVAPIGRGVNFLGYRIWPTHKLLRKQSVTRARRKLRALRGSGRDESRRRFAAAWLGHAQWADSANLLRSLKLEAGKDGNYQLAG